MSVCAYVCAPVGFVYESMCSHAYDGQWFQWRVPNEFLGIFQKFTFLVILWLLKYFKVKICPKFEILQSRGIVLVGSRNDFKLKMGSLGVL